MKLTTRQIALIAIFAALYYILSLISPKIPINIAGVTISLEALIATIFGLVLGPYLGAATAFLGAFVTWTISGMSPFGLPFLMSPPLNALVTGLVYYKKWKWGFIAFSAVIIAFLFTPPVHPITENGIVAAAVLFDKVVAVLLILPLVKFAKHLSIGQGAAFYFILAFVGNQADNIWGSFAFATPMVYGGIFQMPVEAVRAAFLVSPFAYPAIRLIQAFVAMLIAVPLMKALKGTPWIWQRENVLSPKLQPQS
ncbi:MAG: ECF transporter S component [Candidatus Bathyarchaeota archaeon]|nr:ECF transporter S component [Candidatus Bathyarchaeota archaeon]